MPAATRLSLAFVLLLAAFVALAGLAFGVLWVAGEPALAGIVLVAAIAGLVTGGMTWLVVRRDGDEDSPAAEPDTAPVPLRPLPGKPVRVQAMPVAQLPAAYVDAVTRGIRARTRALRAESVLPGPPRS